MTIKLVYSIINSKDKLNKSNHVPITNFFKKYLVNLITVFKRSD